MSRLATQSMVFEGIYDVPEAARILKAAQEAHIVYELSSLKLIRWIRMGIAGPNLTETHGRDLLIAFKDLVSLRIVAALRAAGVSFARVRTAEQNLRELTGHPRPFATESLWTDTSDVFADFRGMLLAASRSGQLAMRLMERHLIPVHGLSFTDGAASSWTPARFVVMRPDIQFGAPCISGTRIPTRALWNSWRGGDSKELLSASYDLPLEEVQAAISWEERLPA